MRRAPIPGLALLLLVAPTLHGQERVQLLAHSPPPVAIPLRPAAMGATHAMATVPQGRLGDVRVTKIGRVVTFTLIGAVVGGAIGYYSYKMPNGIPCNTSTCDEEREPRMVKGALIGGSIGLTIGVISTLGPGTVPTVTMRSGR